MPILASGPLPILGAITSSQSTIGLTAGNLATVSTPISGLVIKSSGANTGKIYIGGGSSVTSSNGYQMSPGEVLNIDENDLLNIWAISDTAAQTLFIIRGNVAAE